MDEEIRNDSVETRDKAESGEITETEEPITLESRETGVVNEVSDVVAEEVAEDQPAAVQAREADPLAAVPGGRQRRFKRKRKMCAFCLEKSRVVDYKEVPRLRRFLTERGKIMPRRQTGTCARHQRMLANAIRRARECALLPFVAQ